MSHKAVFLDRDNTLIEDPGYLCDPDSVRLLPGVELALKSLAKVGYKLVVVTNQSGIARGMFTEETLEKVHDELQKQLAQHDAGLDAIYYCPYHPEGTIAAYALASDLRKPRPGMLLKAAEEMDLDLAGSWMVGDSSRDISAGQRAGCRTIRLRVPGQAEDDAGDQEAQADFVVRNLVDAARIIARESAQAGENQRDRGTDLPSAAQTGQGLRAPGPTPPPLVATKTQGAGQDGPFSVAQTVAGALLVLSGMALVLSLWAALSASEQAGRWASVCTSAAVMAVVLYLMRKP